MKTEKELFKATLIDMGYHESAFSFDSQTGMYALEMTQENWCIWQASANRQGYKLVPVEPNKETLSAMWEALDGNAESMDCIKRSYKAMIGIADE